MATKTPQTLTRNKLYSMEELPLGSRFTFPGKPKKVYQIMKEASKVDFPIICEVIAGTNLQVEPARAKVYQNAAEKVLYLSPNSRFDLNADEVFNVLKRRVEPAFLDEISKNIEWRFFEDKLNRSYIVRGVIYLADREQK
jgi:hypothetical protein